jgi:hypothetical protein
MHYLDYFANFDYDNSCLDKADNVIDGMKPFFEMDVVIKASYAHDNMNCWFVMIPYSFTNAMNGKKQWKTIIIRNIDSIYTPFISHYNADLVVYELKKLHRNDYGGFFHFKSPCFSQLALFEYNIGFRKKVNVDLFMKLDELIKGQELLINASRDVYVNELKKKKINAVIKYYRESDVVEKLEAL